MQNKINILKGMLTSKKFHMESIEREIESTNYHLQSYIKDKRWEWVEHSGKELQIRTSEMKALKAEMDLLEGTINFLEKDDTLA